ncbi:hypothetical protein EV421DRAFT_1841427 [Armillaria borealis]|uniref:Secreted protein n=1 Tax=Armillaria borealis TaxID=47425 RepID=A0AA39J0Z8_9AGAR|nr:hypothetical protein EV421DRAFT_1841427 [Armillaria borealis]
MCTLVMRLTFFTAAVSLVTRIALAKTVSHLSVLCTPHCRFFNLVPRSGLNDRGYSQRGPTFSAAFSSMDYRHDWCY